MHAWMVFLHVIAVFSFLLAHGVSAAVSFALVRERDTVRIKSLLSLSAQSYPVMYLSLLVLLIFGIVAGFTGKWWGEGWIWVSLVLLIRLRRAMGGLGGAVYGKARKAAGLPYFESGKTRPPVEPAPVEELLELLAQGKPILIAVIGYIGIALITWLMMFKPF